MKYTYEQPELEVIAFACSDVLTCSREPFSHYNDEETERVDVS